MIDLTREENVLRIALNRPERKNALNAEMCAALTDAFDEAERESDIRAILLEARGDVFCSGMDLEEVAGPEAAEITAIHERLFSIGQRLRKPLVASVAGPALGGGVGLIANAHIVVASHGCSFGLTEIRVAMWPFVIWRVVVNAIGERRALALALTSRIFSVNEALQWGLVHEVAPPFEVDDRATAIAVHLASQSATAMELGLGFADTSRNMTAADAGALALRERARAFATPDFAEGVAAFREKRKPVWPR
jgi:enoyl-CoA hydratase/carnithine racemase